MRSLFHSINMQIKCNFTLGSLRKVQKIEQKFNLKFPSCHTMRSERSSALLTLMSIFAPKRFSFSLIYTDWAQLNEWVKLKQKKDWNSPANIIDEIFRLILSIHRIKKSERTTTIYNHRETKGWRAWKRTNIVEIEKGPTKGISSSDGKKKGSELPSSFFHIV